MNGALSCHIMLQQEKYFTIHINGTQKVLLNVQTGQYRKERMVKVFQLTSLELLILFILGEGQDIEKIALRVLFQQNGNQVQFPRDNPTNS